MSASILAAFLTAAAGPATADAQPSHRGSGAEIAGAVGSTEDFPFAQLLNAGSSQPCDGIELDGCLPLPQQASQPIADSGSSVLSPELVVTINQAILWLANGSSEPCTAPAGLCPRR
ncbi:hypothetical protein ATM97_11545 [Nocardia sp. MH4]|nr:hypothetical protein [Nocardia sp. MH4]